MSEDTTLTPGKQPQVPRLPLHVLNPDEDLRQGRPAANKGVPHSGSARVTKEDVPTNTTPSKVLRSGKRIPPSTTKKARPPSHLGSAIKANVKGGEEVPSPKPAAAPKSPLVSLAQLNIPAETLTPCAEAIQLLSQGSKDFGGVDDALVNTGSPSIRHVSDISPIMGLVEIPMQSFEQSQGVTTAQAEELSDLLKEIKLAQLTGIASSPNTDIPQGRTPTNTPAVQGKDNVCVPSPGSLDFKSGSLELQFAGLQTPGQDTTPVWHQAPANTPATEFKHDVRTDKGTLPDDLGQLLSNVEASMKIGEAESPASQPESSDGTPASKAGTAHVEHLNFDSPMPMTGPASKEASGSSPPGSCSSAASSAHSGVTSFPIAVPTEASPVKLGGQAPFSTTPLLAETAEVTSAVTQVEGSMVHEAAGTVEGGMNTPEVVVARAPTPDGYIGREKVTPFMERHLKKLQASEWTSPDKKLQVHKSKLELAKEQAIAAKKQETATGLSTSEKAVTRRLVTVAMQKAVQSNGRRLDETLVKHKSKLELAKESATARTPQDAKKPKAKRPSAGFGGQGLGDVMLVHKSKLQKDKEAALAKRAAAGTQADKPLPSYMRATASFNAAKGGLSEMKVHKSKLELDKEAALALQAKDGSLTARSRTSANRSASSWTGGGLGDMKVHKCKLERDREAWVSKGKQVPGSHPIVAVNDGQAVSKPASSAQRTPAQRVPAVSEGKPSYAKPTAAFVTRVTGPATPTTPSGFHYVPN